MSSNQRRVDTFMRANLLTALWSIPPAHSHAHIPPRASLIDSRIERLAGIMGRPATEVKEEIHSVIARRFAKTGEILLLGTVIRCHGEAQAIFDGMHGRDWPEVETGNGHGQ